MPCRPPVEATVAVCVHRADLFLEHVSRLIDVLPATGRVPLRAALVAASSWLRLRIGLDADPFDPFTWRQRGLDLAGGVGLWELPDDQSVLVAAVGWRSSAESFVGDVARRLGLSERHIDGDTTLFVGAAHGAKFLAAGILAGHAWLAELAGPVSIAAARALSDQLTRLAHSDDDGPLARRLAAISGPAHMLRAAGRDESDIAFGFAPSRSEIDLRLDMSISEQSRDIVAFLCHPGVVSPISLPAGALVVLSGLDMTKLERENTSERHLASAVGVALLAIHDIDPGALGALLDDPTSLEDCLRRGDIHASLWMHPDDESPWRAWLEQCAPGSTSQARGQGSTRHYYVPNSAESSWGFWLAFERGTLLGALTEPALASLRTAALVHDRSFESSLLDPQTRALLDRGQPFVYLDTSALADRLASRVRSSWRWQGLGKRLAYEATLAEVITWLRLTRDLTMQVHVPDDTNRMDLSLRLRMR